MNDHRHWGKLCSFRRVTTLLLGVVLAASVASATNYTWTSTTVGNWSASGNWNPGGVPGAAAGDSAFLTNAVAGVYTNILDFSPANTISTLQISNRTGEAWLIVTNGSLTHTTFAILNGGRLRIDNGGVVTVLTNFTWGGTNGVIYLNNGGALYTGGNISLAANVTGLVSSVSAPGQGGVWNFNAKTLDFNTPSALAVNNASITNVGAVTLGNVGTTLTISNGASFYQSGSVNLLIGNSSTASNNVFNVGGGAAAVTVSIGGNQTVVGNSGGSFNSMTVTNAQFTSGTLTVGTAGSLSNRLTVLGGTTMSFTTLNVGSGASTGNVVIVDGAGVVGAGGTVLTNSGQFNVASGSGGFGNTLLLTNAARVFLGNSSDPQVGGSSGTGGSSSNLLIVSGLNTLLASGQSRRTIGVGNAASTGNVLRIENSAIVTNVTLDIGRNTVANVNTFGNQVIVTNSGKLYTTGTSYIGDGANSQAKYAASNSVLIAAGGWWDGGGQAVQIGYGVDANSLVIDGGGTAGGAIATNLYVTVGAWQNTICAGNFNTLIVTNGGRLFTTASGSTVGYLNGGAGGGNSNLAVVVGGSVASLWDGGNQSLVIGSGNLTVTGNVMRIDGAGVAGSAVGTNFGAVTIGASGTPGSQIANGLIVTNGGYFYSTTVDVGTKFGGSNNYYVIDGGTAGSVVSNGAITVGNNGGLYNWMRVANATLQSGKLDLGVNGSTNNTVTVLGGATWRLSGNVTVGSGTAPVGNALTIQGGGLIEANNLTTGAGAGNLITNSGGIYQFTTATPTITTNGAAGGSIFLDNGVISFRNVATADVKRNWSGTDLARITYTRTNAFRLNNATNNAGAAGAQTYVFDGSSPTNFGGLEMVSGGTAYTNGSITIGSVTATNSWLLFSNTTAVIWGAVTNYGKIITANSTVTFMNNLVLQQGSRIVVSTNALSGPMTVNGTLTLPATAIVSLAAPLGANDTITLFTSPNTINGSVAGWTGPGSHVVSKSNNQLILRPRLPGFVFMVD